MRRWAALALLAAAACKDPSPKRLGGFPRPLPAGARITDPVDGATCTRGPETEVAVFEARNFYFCSDATRRRFAADPARYAYAPR